MSAKKMGIVLVIAVVLIAAGAYLIIRPAMQAAVTELDETDQAISDLESYLDFENTDLISGVDDLYLNW
ncbi:MAG: hypothetical protein AB1305_03220 [Candidatus Hadarchaeota archaeon]